MIDPNRARRPLFRSPLRFSDPFLVDWSNATGAVGCLTRWNSSSTGACAGGADVSVRQNFFARSLWRRAGRVRRRLGPAAGLGLGATGTCGSPLLEANVAEVLLGRGRASARAEGALVA